MAELRLGPLLRYVDGSSATFWVETSRPCTAEVRCADGARGSAETFQVDGHHYALVPVDGLTPGTVRTYEVVLDGTTVWPLPDSPFPPSVVRTPEPDAPVRVTFGSCRWAAPPADEKDPVGPDALDTLAARIAADPDGERPDVLLLLGDQVYADEVSRATREWIAARRGLADPPGNQVADYEEYTRLYYESWLDPEIRWLLSTVPSCMIFDDHDVIDDWNTSAAWVADMRATPWWRERVLSGLMSYWVHQHLGNLSPRELSEDLLYAAVRETPDGTDVLRSFAAQADADPASVRWSYRRDFGRTRVLMLDTRAARVLEESNRSMLDPGEERWLREQALDAPCSYDHLLIGTSLPWLLPHLVHDAETWNAALCRGERGARWARFGEGLRRRADLEHWAAFPSSFESLTALIAEAGSGTRALEEAAAGTSAGAGAETAGAEVAGAGAGAGVGAAAEAGAGAAAGGGAAAGTGGGTDVEGGGGVGAGTGAGTGTGTGIEAGIEAGAGAAAPATVLVLSGDVHHAYVAEPSWPGRRPEATVLQLTCSPVHNQIPLSIRLGFRFGWSRLARTLGHRLARHGRCARPPVDWRKTGGPWFGNQLMTLTLRGRSATLRLEQALEVRGGSGRSGDATAGRVRLTTVTESDLTPLTPQ
ncbi:alkaline phosphatase D family protein [Streptomyces sp. NPDC005813]|uniref:alkaline phosphatase D family protein n=1 Tax=Streptomyces sp. NPDC005813 TaxID=3155592 RepID=UPI00341080EE